MLGLCVGFSRHFCCVHVCLRVCVLPRPPPCIVNRCTPDTRPYLISSGCVFYFTTRAKDISQNIFKDTSSEIDFWYFSRMGGWGGAWIIQKVAFVSGSHGNGDLKFGEFDPYRFNKRWLVESEISFLPICRWARPSCICQYSTSFMPEAC